MWERKLKGKGQNIVSHVEVAETGSGKTLVFGLPILQYLVNEETYQDDTRTNELVALIVTPTRKLAIFILSIGKFDDVKIITLVSDMAVRLMDRHSNIIVATPGRCIKFFVLEYARVPVEHFYYVHRSGRTARVQRERISFMLCSPEEIVLS
ncbi:12283_t:CDS:2 [Ambispora gerdemannii]|uniref:RNA helicase n=1 Tax=Ambispora gerdemannii TaxID=144530 RepID=A0A9N9AE55_9GLOM|nr:12283_t:CDS:2 [Ambispora gerdemannii]